MYVVREFAITFFFSFVGLLVLLAFISVLCRYMRQPTNNNIKWYYNVERVRESGVERNMLLGSTRLLRLELNWKKNAPSINVNFTLNSFIFGKFDFYRNYIYFFNPIIIIIIISIHFGMIDSTVSKGIHFKVNVGWRNVMRVSTWDWLRRIRSEL